MKMTASNKRQMRIDKMLQNRGVLMPEDCEELEAEIAQLEQELKNKQTELFKVQRESYKHKNKEVDKLTPNDKTVVRPQSIILQSNVEYQKKSIDLMTMLSGMEVKSYKENDHCVIVYHMQHPAQYDIQHGLKINMSDGQHSVSKFSLPLGFNFDAAVEGFDNIMTAECLGAVRKGLVAYYDRLEQYERLKSLLSIEAQLYKLMDGSHIEITFKVHSSFESEEDDGMINVVLMLDYRVFDIRPKQFSFKDVDLPDGVADVLTNQCRIFKRHPLDIAFKKCFMDEVGPYNLVNQIEKPAPRPIRRPPRPAYHHNRDDTFQPEQEHSSEDDDERHIRKARGRF